MFNLLELTQAKLAYSIPYDLKFKHFIVTSLAVFF